MSKFEPPTKLDSKETVQEESQEQSSLSFQKEVFCPPKQNSTALSENQITKDQSALQNEELHSAKFNSPLEKPKTANKAFGSISDFLLFFENRNPEIKKFAKRFQEMEKKGSSLYLKILNRKIVPALRKSLKNMPVEFKNYESSQNVLVSTDDKKKDEAMQKIKKGFGDAIKRMKMQKEQNKEYVQLFDRFFGNLEDFYKQILHAYTVPGSLYLRMNEYLRTENWVKLDDLLIYTYCLFKAYLWGPTGFTDADSFAYLKSRTENNKLMLYRRADFDQRSLDYYNLERVKEFSWTGVTSSSLKEEATGKFSGKDLTKKPVLILNEVDFQDLQPENFNALYLAKISRCPAEEEVALAPGSIFQLLDINKEKSEVVIRLRLVTNAKVLAHKGQFLHGMLQSVMRNEEELKIVCLDGKDLSRAIKHCKGNLLIEDLEFSLCNFNKKAVDIFLENLPSVKNLKSLMLKTVGFEEDCSLEEMLKCLGILRIEKLEILTSQDQDDQVRSLIKSMQHLKSLKKLNLDCVQAVRLGEELLKDLYDASIQYLSPECSLKLQIQDYLTIFTKQLRNNTHLYKHFNCLLNSQSSEDKKISKNIFSEELRVSKKATHSYQYFLQESQNNNKNLNMMSENIVKIFKTSQRIQVSSLTISDPLVLLILRLARDHLKSLKTLCLHFAGCWKTIEKPPEFLEETGSTKSLVILNLSVETYDQITEKCFQFFRGIEGFNLLTNLNLSFAGSLQITNKVFNFLQIVGYLESLTALNLNFDICDHISDRSLESIQGLRDFKVLTALNLKFSGCPFRAERACILFSTIRDVESLTTFNFDTYDQISDPDLGLFQQVQDLYSLTALHLNFARCPGITDEDLGFLRVMKYLKSLTHFSLNLLDCNQITKKSLEFLQIGDLKSLTTLYLNFAGCLQRRGKKAPTVFSDLDRSCLEPPNNRNQITDKGLQLFRQIGNLKSLTTLHLDFHGCYQITDRGLDFLEEIRHLKLLIILHLNFAGCLQVTERTRNLKSLESLTRFDRNSYDSHQIRDKDLEFIQQFGYLKSLTTLYLNFARCIQITDKTLASLEDIRYLQSLTTLDLDFYGCNKITDKGLELLKNLKYLNSLTFLSLNFGFSDKITDKGLEFLQSIGYLKSLTTLHLNFARSSQTKASTLFGQRRYLGSVTKIGHNSNGCNQITDKGLGFLQQIEDLKSLTALHLNFAANLQLTDQTLNLLQVIGYDKSLTTLSLVFNNCNEMTDQGFKNLCERIVDLRFLKTLSLSFLFCEKIMVGRGDGLSVYFRYYLKFLTDFHLRLNSLRIQESPNQYPLNDMFIPLDLLVRSDTDFKVSSKDPLDISVLCQDNLTLNIQEQEKINDLEEFSIYICCFEDIGNLRRLQTLHFKFSNQSKVSDSHMKKLAAQLVKHSGTLISLRLDFKGCVKITDEGLYILFKEGIQELKLVATLHLNFDECPEITDEGIRLINWRLKSLKNLNLSFNGSEKITEESLDVLCNEGLENLFLFAPSAVIKKEHEKKIFKLVEFLPGYLMIAQNKISERHHQDFNLRRLDLGRKKEQKELKDSQKSAANLICVRKPAFSFGNKTHILNEEIPELIAPDQSFIQEATTKRLRLTFAKEKEISDSLFLQIFGGKVDFLKSLLVLNFSFNMCSDLTDEKLQSLVSHVIQHLNSLNTLQLSFEGCYSLTDKGIESVCRDGLRHLSFLRTLHLVFDRCENVTDQGLKCIFLKETQFFEFLIALHLSFSECCLITDEGLKFLSSEGIQNFKALKELFLNFSWCHKITDEGLKNLFSQRAQYCELLTTLDLNFGGCELVTDRGLKSLCSEGIQHFKALETLSLDFSWCRNLTDSGLATLSCEGIRPLKSLKILNLNFEGLENIKDEGLEILYEKAISRLKSLKTLSLNFDGCNEITTDGFEYFYFQAIVQLPDLDASQPSPTSCKFSCLPLNSLIEPVADRNIKCIDQLWFYHSDVPSKVSYRLSDLLTENENDVEEPFTLSFEDPDQITDNDLDKFVSHEELRRLNNIQNCHFMFDGCSQLMGKGLGYQSFCRMFQNFQSLTTLSLCFNGCKRMTNSGIMALCSEAIQHLKLLVSFNFSFDGENEITDYGFQYLCRNGISHLVSLKFLDLNVNVKGGVSDEGLESLCEGIRNLDKLISLKFILKNGDKITDKGLKILISKGMSRLLKLENIQLSFPQTLKVSSNIYHAFLRILFYFGFESNSNSI